MRDMHVVTRKVPLLQSSSPVILALHILKNSGTNSSRGDVCKGLTLVVHNWVNSSSQLMKECVSGQDSSLGRALAQ